MIIVGNKCDKESREVSFEEAQEFAVSYGLSYMETSVKTGFNVEAVFMQGLEKVCSNLDENKYEVDNPRKLEKSGIYKVIEE